MELILHVSECALYRLDNLCMAWTCVRFDPQPFATQATPNGFRKLRWRSKPMTVNVPVGSRLVAWRGRERARLRVYFDPAGIDAETVLFLATKGQRGFHLGLLPTAYDCPQGDHP